MYLQLAALKYVQAIRMDNAIRSYSLIIYRHELNDIYTRIRGQKACLFDGEYIGHVSYL